MGYATRSSTLCLAFDHLSCATQSNNGDCALEPAASAAKRRTAQQLDCFVLKRVATLPTVRLRCIVYDSIAVCMLPFQPSPSASDINYDPICQGLVLSPLPITD